MANQESQQIANDVISAVQNSTPINDNNLTLEQLIVLINLERVRSLETKSKTELQALKERYGDTRALNDLRKAINNSLTANSNIDCTKNPEIQKMLDKAKTLGVPVIEGKTLYTKEEADRLLDNIKMTIDDLNIQNDLQMQQVSRLQNEHHDSFQLAMSIIRPVHGAKTSMVRGINGGR